MVLLLVLVGRVEGGEPLAAVGAHDLPAALAVHPAHVNLGKVGVLEDHVAQQASVDDSTVKLDELWFVIY